MGEWYQLTGDSFCVAMRGVNINKNHFERQGIAEVFKYAVKFSTLPVPKLVELIALQKRKQYRFYATTGVFRGWRSDIQKKLIRQRMDYIKVIGYSDFVFDEKVQGYQ